MKTKTLKKWFFGFAVLIASLATLLFSFVIFHRIRLNIEQEQLIPPGHMVEVDGGRMHVYIAGENDEAPLLVFLAGHGTFAPVYNFRPLYSLLTSDFRIAVVEKFGYGYSDFTDTPRNIDIMLSELRAALFSLDETGPFVLLPHSMAGLEALRWAQLYPDEVVGIVGNDIAVPNMYLHGHVNPPVQFFRTLSWMGLQRIPGLIERVLYPYPARECFLTPEEYAQQRLLIFRNSMNQTVAAESTFTVPNSQTIMDDDLPRIPMLMLVSVLFGETEGYPFFIPYSEEFAQAIGAQIEFFDEANHFIHQYEPERAADLVRTFVIALQEYF